MDLLGHNVMRTIEERASDNLSYERDFCGRNLSDGMVCRAYVRGAEEQKVIDFANAKTAFNKSCGRLSTYPWYEEMYEEFIKSLEE